MFKKHLLFSIYFTKLLFIISDKNEEISNAIGKEVKRGVTGLYGKGMYSNKDKLICPTFSKNYFDFLVITNIFKCKNINLETDLLYLIRLNYKVMLLNKYNYKSYHKDISFLSGHTKAIITKYGIARTDFKKLMIHHQIPNLKKSSW